MLIQQASKQEAEGIVRQDIRVAQRQGKAYGSFRREYRPVGGDVQLLRMWQEEEEQRRHGQAGQARSGQQRQPPRQQQQQQDLTDMMMQQLEEAARHPAGRRQR